MSRFHIHIAVNNLPENIRFYSAMFGTQPTVEKSDYAKWALDNPAINFAISTRGKQPGLDHVGIQADDDSELKTIQHRLAQANIAGVSQENTACCYAKSDKYWSVDPQGIAWESFHTLNEIPTFNDGEQPQTSGCCIPVQTQTPCC